ncbi:MAG TPA: hypothetical protein PLV85_15235, partial [Polyangiaceae bacterium]|nr:hypothetical protein [Polyangiaceae bacterium]
LYEPQSARAGRLPTPFILSFKGERGRNPQRVFSDLITALSIEKIRDQRDVVLHVFTHAALYIPRRIVENLVRIAQLGIVFILPSGGSLDLDYLDLLHAHFVVDHDTLASRGARAEKARDILGQIGSQSPQSPMVAVSHSMGETS